MAGFRRRERVQMQAVWDGNEMRVYWTFGLDGRLITRRGKWAMTGPRVSFAALRFGVDDAPYRDDIRWYPAQNLEISDASPNQRAVSKRAVPVGQRNKMGAVRRFGPAIALR